MVWRKGTLLPSWWKCKLIQSLWRTVWRFFKKRSIQLPYEPAIPLLFIYLQKSELPKDTCTPMFTAAVFPIPRSWKQPKCPSTDQWIRKWWYIYTMEYSSAIKRNKIESFVKTWMDVKTVIQNEFSQKVKKKSPIFTYVSGT